MINIIEELANLADEPLISNEEAELLNRITSITRTSEFEPMNLSDEVLDELIEKIKEQEGFSQNIPDIVLGLEMSRSIILIDDEEDYV